MPAPLVLLPPSQSKDEGGRFVVREGPFDAVLGPTRRLVTRELARLVEASDAEFSRLVGARGALLDHTRRVTRDLVRGRSPLLPAWRRYTGVVWTHLEPQTLSATQRRRVLVPSGLYGVSRADDLISEYRLTMSARLGGERLARTWRFEVSRVLAAYAGRRRVYDLLPREHRAALDATQMAGVRRIGVDFVGDDGGAIIGHQAKAAKGSLARYILEHGRAEGFGWRGWRAECSVDAVRVILRAS